MDNRHIAIGIAAMTAAIVLVGCDAVECGDGTLEVDGVCAVADSPVPDPAACGGGTTYDALTQTCWPTTAPTECGPNTVPEVQADGTVSCVGTGDGGGCAGPIACAAPSGGRTSVCGRIHDTGDGSRIEATDASGTACDPDSPTSDGPCSLRVRLYDPLAFAADPTGTTPLDVEQLVVDDCGRFAAIGVTRPFNGFLAVAVDDAASEPDDYALTGIAFPIEANGRRPDARAFATRRISDDEWTTTAGNPFGAQTFVERGVFMPVFMNGDQPVAGVTITSGGSVRSGDDYYFSDTNPGLRSTIDGGLSVTGANGAGLLLGSSLTQHSGDGGEPAGCEWPSDLAASIPGVVFFREVHAHAAGDPEQPCGGQ